MALPCIGLYYLNLLRAEIIIFFFILVIFVLPSLGLCRPGRQHHCPHSSLILTLVDFL
jgi:hypothetical protein